MQIPHIGFGRSSFATKTPRPRSGTAPRVATTRALRAALPPTTSLRAALRTATALTLASALLAGCAAKTETAGGETNWLTACDEDNDCDSTTCLCGACSTECTRDNDCDGVSNAVCADPDGPALDAQCGAARSPICLPVCSRDGDCGDDQRCLAGTCVLDEAAHPEGASVHDAAVEPLGSPVKDAGRLVPVATEGGATTVPSDLTDAGVGIGVTCDQSLPMAAYVLSGKEGTLPEGLSSVLEVGTGVPPDDALGYRVGCVGEFEWALIAGQLDLDGDTVSDLRWLRFEHEGSEHWLTLQAPSLELPFAAGDSFSLSTGHECDSQGATDSFIELRDESDELVFWLSQAYSFGDVETPAEFSLSPGDTVCVGEYWNALQVEVMLDGATRSLEPGTQVEFGEFMFTHGTYTVETRPIPASHASGYFIRMAAWRR